MKNPHVLRLRFSRTWKLMLGVSLGATTVAAVCSHFGWLGINDSELSAYDQGLTTFTQHEPKSKDIVLLAIDDATFQDVRNNESYAQTFGTWPYARNIWARIFERLMEDGARAIVFDSVMDERSTNSGDDLAMAQVIVEKKVPFYLGFGLDPRAKPLPLVLAANRLPGDVVGKRGPVSAPASPSDDVFPEEPTAGQAAPAADAPPPLDEVARALAFPVVAHGMSLGQLVTEDRNGKEVPQHPLSPIPPLISTTSGFGVVELEEDGDGKMRRTRFAYTDGVNSYVTLSLAVAADLFGADKVELSPGSLKVGVHEFRINPRGDAEIDFGGKVEERFEVLSLIHVLDDWVRTHDGRTGARLDAPKAPLALKPGTFRNKIVMIGGFATGTADVKATPFTSHTPGITKHASELQCFLDGRFITDAPYLASLLVALLVAFLSICIVMVVRSTVVEIGWPLVLFFGFFAVTGIFLVLTKIHVLTAMPRAAGEFASLAAVALNHLLKSHEEREELRTLFSQFMEPGLVDIMVEQKRLPDLEGESVEVSAMFSDIRGFTTFSEQLKDRPRELVKVLNTYLSRTTEVLVAEGACIDKYIGDSVVCLFGAPVKQADHAVRACRAALAMQAEVAKLREEFRAQGLPDVYTRVGVNSGRMLVCAIGSARLRDYTAIGDEMNLASRLEGINKVYESLVLIGPTTYQLAKEHIEVREVDTLRVAGKHQPVIIYELLAMKGELPAVRRALFDLYAQALGLYRVTRFAEAAAFLERVTAADPADGPSRVLLARCQNLVANPPPMPFEAVTNLGK